MGVYFCIDFNKNNKIKFNSKIKKFLFQFYKIAKKQPSSNETILIDDDSFDETQQQKQQPAVGNKHQPRVFIEETIDEEKNDEDISRIQDVTQPEKASSKRQDTSNKDDFVLALSSTSTSDDDDEVKNEENEKDDFVPMMTTTMPPPKQIPQRTNISPPSFSQNNTNNVTLRRRSKCANKRVSICGQAFSDDVLNIDDTIIDEYDNELDHKSGKLFSLVDSQIERDLASGDKSNIFSSTQMSSVIKTANNINNNNRSSGDNVTQMGNVNRKDASSTDDDDRFENCKIFEIYISFSSWVFMFKKNYPS